MTGQPDWWEGFFSGLWLEVQRQFKSEEQTQAEADFIEKALALAPGAHVLDAPCGEGRIALTLAARGYQVTGVDITEPLLDDARRQAATRGLDVTWERRDMRDLPWEGAFDAVLCFWGSFGYFDDAGNIEHVQAVARALKPGGASSSTPTSPSHCFASLRRAAGTRSTTSCCSKSGATITSAAALRLSGPSCARV